MSVRAESSHACRVSHIADASGFRGTLFVVFVIEIDWDRFFFFVGDDIVGIEGTKHTEHGVFPCFVIEERDVAVLVLVEGVHGRHFRRHCGR